jgi:hypothetical protein
MAVNLGTLGLPGVLWIVGSLCALVAATSLTWDAPAVRRFGRPALALALAFCLGGALLAVDGANQTPDGAVKTLGAAGIAIVLILGAWHQSAQASRAGRLFSLIFAWLGAAGMIWAWARLLL